MHTYIYTYSRVVIHIYNIVQNFIYAYINANVQQRWTMNVRGMGPLPYGVYMASVRKQPWKHSLFFLMAMYIYICVVCVYIFSSHYYYYYYFRFILFRIFIFLLFVFFIFYFHFIFNRLRAHINVSSPSCDAFNFGLILNLLYIFPSNHSNKHAKNYFYLWCREKMNIYFYFLFFFLHHKNLFFFFLFYSRGWIAPAFRGSGGVIWVAY